MRKLFIKISFLAVSIIVAYSIYAGFRKDTSQNNIKPDYSDEKIELLENAIIVYGLEQDIEEDKAETSSESTEMQEKGNIYYVTDFEADIESTENKADIPDNELIKKLKKSDIRWHYSKYKIQKGDNLWTIAEKFGISHVQIIKANLIINPDRLLPGKELFIPNKNGYFYTVKKGDTLSEISSKHKKSTKFIAKYNGINSDKIYVGMKIFLPDSVKPNTEKVLNTKPNKAIKKNVASKSDKKIIIKHSNRPDFIWPLKNKITSSFGMRKHPITGKNTFHCGVDIGAVTNTNIKSSYTGKVIFNGWKGGYGKMIVIEHKNNYITVYAHLNKILVKKGDYVKTGQIIAKSGATGTVTGPHLHFEIRKYLTPLNPIQILRK